MAGRLRSRALRSRSPALLGFNPDFKAAATRDELACIRVRAERASENLLRQTITYWRFCLSKGEAALVPGSGLLHLAQFLHHCEFPPRAIGVRHSSESAAGPVLRIFEGTFGVAPAQFSLNPRAGRPPISLVLGSCPERLRANGRGACMSPFHSLMLAILVWQQLLETKNEIT